MAKAKGDLPGVSEKNKKSEILEAYNALVSKISDSKQMSLHEIKKQEEEQETVENATALNGDKIAKGVMELKLSIMHDLDALEQKMSGEYRQLVDLQAAIKIESKNLQDLYEIKKNADSLAALLLAQKERKEEFQEQMVEQKRQWAREQEEFELLFKEERVKAKRDRVREEEEYSYNLKLKRKKEADAYEAHKKALEKQLQDREFSVKTKEDELARLQEHVEAFPAELEKAIKDTEKSIKAQIEAYYKHQIDLSTCEVEAERKLTQQTIDSLQEKIQEQEAFIKQLTQKADTSTHQVQEIAIKAIEGSASRFYGAREQYKKENIT